MLIAKYTHCYALRNISLFRYSSNISLSLIVSYKILSLSTSTSAIVVNFIEVFILLFYFLTSSSSFCIFFRAILRDVVSTVRVLISLLGMSFSFCGSYSIIFCNRLISFSRFIFFVFSLIFSLVRLLFKSLSKNSYFLALNYRAAWLLFPDNCYWIGSWFLAGYSLKSIVFYLRLFVLLFAELRQGDAFLRRFALLNAMVYQGGIVDGVRLCRTNIIFLLFLGFELSLSFVFALEGDNIFSFLCEVITTIIFAISSLGSYFFIDLKV